MCIVHFTYIFTGQYAMVYMIDSRLLFTQYEKSIVYAQGYL